MAQERERERERLFLGQELALGQVLLGHQSQLFALFHQGLVAKDVPVEVFHQFSQLPGDHDQLAVGHPGVFSRGIAEVLHEGDGLAHIQNECGRGQASRSQRSRVAVERPGCN